MTTPLSGMVCDLYSTTILSIIPVQFTCLTIFLHNLSPSLLWSTSWSGALHLILHTFLYPISVFFFATHAHTIAGCFAVVQRSYHLFLISLSQLFTWDFYLNITHPSDHSHLCSLHLVGTPVWGDSSQIWPRSLAPENYSSWAIDQHCFCDPMFSTPTCDRHTVRQTQIHSIYSIALYGKNKANMSHSLGRHW